MQHRTSNSKYLSTPCCIANYSLPVGRINGTTVLNASTTSAKVYCIPVQNIGCLQFIKHTNTATKKRRKSKTKNSEYNVSCNNTRFLSRAISDANPHVSISSSLQQFLSYDISSVIVCAHEQPVVLTPQGHRRGQV